MSNHSFVPASTINATNPSSAVSTLAASLAVASSPYARADCGNYGQDPCGSYSTSLATSYGGGGYGGCGSSGCSGSWDLIGSYGGSDLATLTFVATAYLFYFLLLRNRIQNNGKRKRRSPTNTNSSYEAADLDAILRKLLDEPTPGL